MPNIFDGRTDSHEVEAATSGGLARIRDHFVLVVVVSVSVVVVVLDIVVVVVVAIVVINVGPKNLISEFYEDE